MAAAGEWTGAPSRSPTIPFDNGAGRFPVRSVRLDALGDAMGMPRGATAYAVEKVMIRLTEWATQLRRHPSQTARSAKDGARGTAMPASSGLEGVETRCLSATSEGAATRSAYDPDRSP